MIYKLVEEENGEYIGSDGKRYTILEAQSAIYTPEGINIGCVELPDFETALKYFKVEMVKKDNDEEN